MTQFDQVTQDVEADFRRATQQRRRYDLFTHLALNVSGVLLFLGLWESTPRLVPWVNEVLFPPPSEVLQAFLPLLLSGELLHDVAVSLGRAIAGFLIASVCGVVVGLFTARSRLLNYLTEPLLQGFRSVPVIALVPFSVLWFGIGEGAKVVLIAWGSFFPIWISTHIGVRDVNIVYLRSAACLGAGPIGTMALVVLPAALPLILAGLRQSIAISFIVLVAAELSGARAGIAYLMSMGHQLFRVDVMFIGLGLLGFFGFMFDRLFVVATRRLFPWYVSIE